MNIKIWIDKLAIKATAYFPALCVSDKEGVVSLWNGSPGFESSNVSYVTVCLFYCRTVIYMTVHFLRIIQGWKKETPDSHNQQTENTVMHSHTVSLKHHHCEQNSFDPSRTVAIFHAQFWFLLRTVAIFLRTVLVSLKHCCSFTHGLFCALSLSFGNAPSLWSGHTGVRIYKEMQTFSI